MTNLVEIIYAITQATARMPVELPRGLHLVYYPPAGDEPARLIAARHLSAPSPTELRVVRDALIAALDLHEYRVADAVATEWQDAGHGDWNGYQLTYHILSSSGAFSPDAGERHRVRLALEQREARVLKRREKAQASKQTKSTQNPML